MAWTIDTSHSSIEFVVRHMMISTARGSFKSFTGNVVLDENALHLAEFDITIDASSISTNDDRRDGHLKSPDFFDVATYPNITFKSTKIELADGKQSGKVTGDLTIRDVTKPVTFEVEMVGINKNPYGKTIAGFNAHTAINRKDFGLNWNVALEAGGWLVSDDIRISVEVELIKAEETVPATA